MQFKTGRYAFSPPALALVALGSAWLIYAAFFAPAGLFTDDEIIYVGMIDRFATAGSFVIENGYDIVPAQSLRLVTLREGLHGLVPQYPAGFAIVAAPFYLVGGLQGIIFLNALATVLTLWLTYLIARELFEDERLGLNAALIFGLATFAVDYAFGIWPHATANLFVTGAIYGAVRASGAGTDGWWWGAMAGLLIGLGTTIRADVVIAAPILFAWLFVTARYPGRVLGTFSALLAAGLLAAAWLNFIKFGHFNPLSYGVAAVDSANLALGGYVKYLPYAIVLGLIAMSLRWKKVQDMVTTRGGVAFMAILVLAVLAVPPTQQLAFKVANGLYALIVDLRHLSFIDWHPRIEAIGGQFYLYYGILKKSLVENLPYLGLAAFAVSGMFRSGRRAAYALCLFFPMVWFLPFAAQEWIGGLANNLRYLSPALPMLAVLGAAAWQEIKPQGPGLTVLTFLAGGLLAAGLLFGYSLRSEMLSPIEAFFVTGGAQWLALGVLLFSTAWLLFRDWQSRLRVPFAVLAQSAFLLAFVAAYPFDAWKTRETRLAVEYGRELLQYLEPNAHVFATGQFALYFQLTRPEATLAFYVPEDISSDLKLMDLTLRRGRPVYIMTLDLTRRVRKALLDHGYVYGPGGFEISRSVSPVDGRHYDLYRLTRAGP